MRRGYTVIYRRQIMQSNPLANYYRKPPTYVSLPSRGKYYKQPPKLSVDGELAVYPLTARHEMLLKNPDSLLNGDALFKVLSHVAPDIPDASEMPMSDVEAVFVAMRIASYGKETELDCTCPKCSTVTRVGVDLPPMLARVNHLEEQYTCTLDSGLSITLTPKTLKTSISESLVGLEQERMILAIADDNKTVEERAKIYADSMAYLTDKAVSNLASYVLKVTTPDGTVISEQKYIMEWADQISIDEYKEIQKQINEIDKGGLDSTITVKCNNEECKEEYKQQMQFDPARFFA